MDLEYKSCEIEIKADAAQGTFVGLASPYDNIDDGLDRAKPTIGKRNNNKKVPMLWQHDTKQILGSLLLLDTKQGIQANGVLILDKDNSGQYMIPKAAEAYALLKKGLLKLSIGYKTLKFSYEMEKGQTIRNLDDIEICEVSLVTFPMNEKATISDVKSQQIEGDNLDGLEEKGVSGSTALPVADKVVKWDGNAAAKRVLDKYTDNKGNIGAEAKKAFFYYDETKPNNRTSYKFGFADIVNDTLTAVPAGILACANALRGARNASTLDINIKKGIAKKVNAYLKKLKYAEVQESEIKAGENILEVKENGNLEEKAMSYQDRLKVSQANDMRWRLMDALNGAFRDLMADENMTLEDKVTQLNQNIDDFAKDYKTTMTTLLQASAKSKTAKKSIEDSLETKSNEEQLETKAGKKISKANKTKLSQCKDMMSDLADILASLCEDDTGDGGKEDDDTKACGGKTTKKATGKTPPADSKTPPTDPKQTGKEPPVDPKKPGKQEKSNDGTLELKSEDIEELKKISNLFNKGDEQIENK